MNLAMRLIDEAKEGGANAIKFQTYKADTLVSKNSPAYWDLSKEPIKNQYELFKKYDKFWKDEFVELKTYCDKTDIEFLSTPFDLESASFLNDMMDVFKVSSSDITNKPFIQYICDFGKPLILSTGASNLDEIKEASEWVESKDNPLACYLKTLGANLFRGSESDLIERFYEAAKKWQATRVVRISADCPFISGSEIDRLITFFKSGNYDFAYNNVPVNNCYPDGIGAEIMSFAVLEKLHKEAKNQYDREHVSTYIHSHPQTFKIGTFDPEDQILQCPETRIDLDTPEDYEKLMRMDVNINMDAHEIVNAANLVGKRRQIIH
jgi:spore coat polysaccharide biosynthesis protein SpsF (cytidylyltransferase family)